MRPNHPALPAPPALQAPPPTATARATEEVFVSRPSLAPPPPAQARDADDVSKRLVRTDSFFFPDRVGAKFLMPRMADETADDDLACARAKADAEDGAAAEVPARPGSDSAGSGPGSATTGAFDEVTAEVADMFRHAGANMVSTAPRN